MIQPKEGNEKIRLNQDAAKNKIHRYKYKYEFVGSFGLWIYIEDTKYYSRKCIPQWSIQQHTTQQQVSIAEDSHSRWIASA